ncbi:hypothetical protein [Membranihabitans maritimus]|uniref:hypothetical protein n=1 Tax=Membranihabitans maritimus TaxID=2904244 RepID=UPI001F23E4E6|nr:hypothetical protein [Membranihabitans maritimus]
MKFNFLNSVLIVFGLTFALASCDKDEDNNPDLPYDDVFGTWEWISTSLESGEKIIADSVEYTQSLEITQAEVYTWTLSDSTVTDSVVFTSDFEIFQDTINSEDDAEYFFDFDVNTAEDQSFYIKSQDTLYLEDQCDNCDSHIFVRN